MWASGIQIKHRTGVVVMAQLVQVTLDGPTNPPLISGLFLQTPFRCTVLLELEAHCSVLHGCLLITDGILTQPVPLPPPTLLSRFLDRTAPLLDAPFRCSPVVLHPHGG